MEIRMFKKKIEPMTFIWVTQSPTNGLETYINQKVFDLDEAYLNQVKYFLDSIKMRIEEELNNSCQSVQIENVDGKKTTYKTSKLKKGDLDA
jgi:hypothetical protein